MAGSMEWLLVVCVCLSVTASALALKAELEEYDNTASVAMDELEFVDTEHLNYASSQGKEASQPQKRPRDDSTDSKASKRQKRPMDNEAALEKDAALKRAALEKAAALERAALEKAALAALDKTAREECNDKIKAAFDDGVLSTDTALICKKMKPTPDLKIQWCNRVANMYALPVGQGDCTVITCPSETDPGDIVLVDCGAKPAGDIYSSSGVKEFLQLEKVRATVVITHGDKDHYNYLQDIFTGFDKDRLDIIVGEENAVPKENLPNGKLHVVNGGKECIGNCPQFKHLLCGKGSPLNFNILAANVGDKKNQKSIVLKVSYKDGPSLLLPGDMEYNAMGKIADKLSESKVMNADFYKIAHHGAASTDSGIFKKWLNAIVPNRIGEVFVSHGFKNKYHHPRCESIGGVYDPYARRCRGIGLSDQQQPPQPQESHTFQCYQPKSSDYELDEIKDRCMFNTFLEQNNGKSIACIIYIAINSDSVEVVSPCSCKTQCFCHVQE